MRKTVFSISGAFLCLAVVGLAVLTPGTTFGQAPFMAGTSRVEVTPPLGIAMSGWASREHGATGIDDPLYIKAMVITDGADTVTLIAADLIGFPREIVTEIREGVVKTLGIKPDHVMVSASHTHFGPDLRQKTAYRDNLAGWAIGAVKMAADRLEPVDIACGEGDAPGLGYNRRGRKPDGTISMIWHLPPQEGDRLVGPVDSRVGVIRIDGTSGAPLAAVINYAAHPVCNENRFYDFSADYPGVAAGVIEAVTGARAFFTLGTCGDINPAARGEGAKKGTGLGLGGEVLRVWAGLTPSRSGGVGAANRIVNLPRKEPETGREKLETEVQVIRIGDAYLVGLPGEILVRIGNSIKEKAGHPHVYVSSITNDYISYVPGREEFPVGGYEVGRSLVAPGADDILVETSLELIGSL